MKKQICVWLAAGMISLLTACGSQSAESKPAANVQKADTVVSKAAEVQPEETPRPEEPAGEADSVDIDLSALSSTMVYAEITHMLDAPDDYAGKTVKTKGRFAYYENPYTQQPYFVCVVTDAAACCTQGLEFLLTGEHAYPDDYPAQDSEITVTGTFALTEENGLQECKLVNAVLAGENGLP